MRRFSTAVCCSLILSLGTVAQASASHSTAPADTELDYEAIAREALTVRGMADRTPETFDFAEYCARGFVHLEVGLFDLYMDQADFADKDQGKRLFKTAHYLAAIQLDWLHLVDPTGKRTKTQKTVAKNLAAFLKSAPLDSAYAGGFDPKTGDDGLTEPKAIDLWTRLDVQPNDLKKYRELATYLQTDGGLGMQREAQREPIVFFPDRAKYVELITLAGWARPEARERMWNPDIFTWTNFYVGDWRFLAMSYGVADASPENYGQGTPMEDRTPSGLGQQVCQLAVLGLLDNYFGGRIPPAVAGGLTLNLVIDQFGECNTRVDGDLRERRTEAREQFVPGGNPNGGVLPPNLADSRWRETHGSDRFMRILRGVQTAGAGAVSRKERKDKVRYFELVDDDGANRKVIAGPILGQHSQGGLGSLPDTFLGDRLEFSRSYSCGFLYWLREKGGHKKNATSRDKFAELLVILGNSEEPDGGGILAAEPSDQFDSIFTEHYGKALSDVSLEPVESLEGGFLHWLAKGR